MTLSSSKIDTTRPSLWVFHADYYDHYPLYIWYPDRANELLSEGNMSWSIPFYSFSIYELAYANSGFEFVSYL